MIMCFIWNKNTSLITYDLTWIYLLNIQKLVIQVHENESLEINYNGWLGGGSAVKHVYNDNFGSKKNWLYMRGGP